MKLKLKNFDPASIGLTSEELEIVEQFKKGGNLIYKYAGGGALEAAIKFLKEGFGGSNTIKKLAGQTGFGNDKMFIEEALNSLEKIGAREGGSVQDLIEVYSFDELRGDILQNMVKPTPKAKGSSSMKATVFYPEDVTMPSSNLFGESVSINLKNLTKQDRTSANKVSTVMPIREAEGKTGLGFNTEPNRYTVSASERNAGHQKGGTSSKGKQTPVLYIDDKELTDFKQQILAPTAELRGADPNQTAFVKQANTAGIVEQTSANNLDVDYSSYADGFARITKASSFDRISGDKIKSMLVHENLGHGMQPFLERSYVDSFDQLVKGDHRGDTRALLMEAKFFLWKEAKRIAKKDTITPEELNEFISKVPNKELKELFSVLNHRGVENKGTGTSIAQNFMKDPKRYKEVLGKMLGVTALAGTAGVAATTSDNSAPMAKQGMKFQEGGTIEEIPFYEQIAEIPIFRHLQNNLIANDFDNDLSDLLARKEINYGQLSEDAEIELQKKYNLSSRELNETLDDLFNAGMGKSLVADLFKVTSNLQTLKQGGVIQKCSIGSAIKKFAGEGLENLGERAVKELGEEITLQATGSAKVIGKATTNHLQKVAKATGDQRIKVLADFAEQCRNKGIKLPEEFNQYVDAIFKTPTAVKKDTKITRVGKEITAKPEFVEYKGKTVERPTFEKTKYKTKTIHTGEFRNELEFKRTIPKTQEELQLISPKIDEAINSLRSMMEGDQFKLTPMMMDEVYFKSKGRVQNFSDTKEQSRLIRKLFGEIEYPNIVKRQLDYSYIHPQTPSQELSKFYDASADNIEWFKGIKDFTQFHTLYHLNLPGEVQITPLKIKPKAKQLAVYHNTGNFVSFLPKQIMTKQDTPYIKAYGLTINGKPIKGIPTFKFEEHHSTPLALMQAEAYLTNPLPKNTMEHVRTYQNQRKVNGSKNSHYDNFLVLNKAEHTGINGIHYNDRYSLQDLQRIKAISRSGRFKTMEDLLNYYDQLKTQQLAYLPKARFGIKLIPKSKQQFNNS